MQTQPHITQDLFGGTYQPKPAMSKHLRDAKAAKKDEFYTQYDDIAAEVECYVDANPDVFRDKTVYCNCDNPLESNFFKLFFHNFDTLGLRRLLATCWDGCEINRDAMRADVTRRGGNRHIDIDPLTGNGDFRSKECIELLKEADIVVTNPPFSLFRQYVALLVKYEKKFLIIGNQNAIIYKEFFPLIKENKIWLGPSITSGDRKFNVPDDYELHSASQGVDPDGRKYVRVPSIRWFTNLDHKRRHLPLDLYKHYSPEEYPKYDNYDAIEVSKTSEIPTDYDGVMGVPITFLDKYCPEQFEIVGMAKRGAGDPALKSKVYTKEQYSNYSDLNAGPTLFDANGKLYNTYPRILIRKKHSHQ